jgi:hypothetical protein
MSAKINSNGKINSEIDFFYGLAKQRHRRINPCFMTGKGCVHTEHIDNELEERNNKNDCLVCFMVRPFRANFDAFNRLCLERYFQENYSYGIDKLEMEQADRIRRTGYIVCEKICRRVQSVDFLVIDVSSPNANVFYELGIAYGIEQKIIVIYQEKSEFGKKVADYLENAGCKAYPYKDLNPILTNEFKLSQHLWHPIRNDSSISLEKPSILFISRQYGFLAKAEAGYQKKMNIKTSDDEIKETDFQYVNKILGPPDIELGIETHVKAAIGVAVANIVEELNKKDKKSIPEPYINLIQGLITPDEVKKEANFNEVRQQLDKAYCTIIHTGGKGAEPMAYFWLGYCHANGKNVIPVTVVNEANEDIDDLAFDIRALWHMTFSKSNPIIFAEELQGTLHQMILTDFTEWSRNRFWDKMLNKRGRVSIFSGALHNDPIGRDMIGDWDLRSASELTSFFASHQYRATIESPVYQIEQFTQKRIKEDIKTNKKDYIVALEGMLKDKNCIIIASADVNPLTEIILGKLYKIDQNKWFTESNYENVKSSVISFKEIITTKSSDIKKLKESKYLGRIFYIQQPIENDSDNRLKRGFKGHGVPDNVLSGEFLSQKDETASFRVHAHLVIAKNPYDQENSERHHIIILNGVSGPATFALTHVLTGGTSSQFVAYSENFDPNSKSESFLEQINKDIDDLTKSNISGIQYFVEVEVGPPKDEKDGIEKHIFDWRRILSWQRVGMDPDTIYSNSNN